MSKFSRNTLIIAKREFAAYFASPLAAIFTAVFVALSGAFAFYVGGFFERSQADLVAFFTYHPWLYLLLVPAVSMRLWAEERKTGSIELLMTLPITPWQAIVGKYLAAWAVIAVALACTVPLWVTVNILGSPDNSVIAASYFGSFLTAGAFLAIGSCLSALTKNQVIAFIATATVCFLMIMSGLDLVLGAFRAWTPEIVVTAISSMSILSHYEDMTRGLVGLPGLIFFLSLIAFSLFANKIILDIKQAA